MNSALQRLFRWLLSQTKFKITRLVKTDWEFEKLRDTEDLRLFDISEFVSGSPSTELLTEAYLDSAYKEIRRRAFWPLLLFSIAAAFPILCFIALNRSEFEKSPLTFSLPFWSAIVFSLVCVGIGRRLSLQDHTIIMSEIRGNFRSASLFERAEIAYKHLRSNKAPVYLRYQNGTIVKLGSKVWNLGVVPLYLFGDERVRRAIQPDSAQPCARVYFDERDLNSIVLPSGQKEVKEDSFCAHVKALLGNEKILRRYAENYLNWRDPEHKDYKGEIDPKDIRYHNVIIHFYENRDVLTNWYQKKKSDDERITTFEQEIYPLLGLGAEMISEFRRGRYRPLNAFPKELNFIDLHELPTRPNKSPKKIA